MTYYTACIITTYIHTFAGSAVGAKIVYVIITHRNVLHAAAKINPDIDIVNFKVFQINIGWIRIKIDSVTAVAANFQRMVRIADSMGIPIDEKNVEVGAGIRQDLGLSRFASAENTPSAKR